VYDDTYILARAANRYSLRMRYWVIALFVVGACGDNKKAPEDAGIDAPTSKCGNGVVDIGEQCDDGDANGTTGAKCTTTCSWVCLDDTWCTDMEPCNGAETCADHACFAGTAQADGTSCGTGKLCRNEVCSDAACGDQFVTAPNEECDDANSTAGDGCENNCRYSCLSTDVTRNCTPADPCQGQGTCNDTTHVCTPGTPLQDNTSCGTGRYCKTGVCTMAVCGNGMTEPGETCDLGSQNGMMGSGCKADCTYECVNAATDCPAAPFCQMPSCDSSHACANVADPAKNGMMCGTNLVCSNGACVTPSAVCGNGTTETGEQCDFGSANGPGTGCESNCQFSCTILPDSCDDGNPCNGTETCTMIMVNGRPGQRCNATAAPAPGTMCGSGQICLGMLCVTSTCGDGFVSTINGEQCEPPNTMTCSSTCRNIVCGDGVRAGTEQCDDNNTTNLDGCDSTCKFEQCHRVNSLSIGLPPSMLTSTFCPVNQLGSAITGNIAQTEIRNALTNGVNDGSITIELKAGGLDDLTGTFDPQVSLGVLTGSPVAGAGYNGAMDLDWWYTTSAMVIDAMRNPTTSLAGSIAMKVLNAGPSDITITINLAGVPARLDMLRATLRGNIGNATTPLASTGSTPGHLASENLDPALQSFAAVTGGELCGDVIAASLNAVPAPMALQGCGLFNCSQCYTASNTLLDVIVGGCNTLAGQQVRPTQPDTGRVATDDYVFTPGAGRRVANGTCTRNLASHPITMCLNDAAYSSFFRFTSDRVIAK
jgi:cysteine-rich repeat protein